jgi:hypothetical protein
MSEQHVPVDLVRPLAVNPVLSALRADDFLSVEFEFVNLQVSMPSPGRPVLTIVNPAQPAHIIVHFPPQSIAEQAFWLAADEPGKVFPVPPDQPPEPGATETPDKYMSKDGPFLAGHPRPVALSRIAGPSRLAFTVPANAGPIPYSLQSLLEKCFEFAPSIAPTAEAPPFRFTVFPHLHIAATEALATTPIAPAAASPGTLASHSAAVPLAALMVQHRAALQAARSLTFKIASGAIAAGNMPKLAFVQAQPVPLPLKATETAIEMPYRLIISPNQYGAWAHAATPVTSQFGRTELWHTRLGSRPAADKPIDETAKTQMYFRNLSAIWPRDQTSWPPASPVHDQIPSTTGIPFRTSLDAFDRWNIVHQSFGRSDVVTNRLMLTSLGGWLDARGSWDSNSPVKEWRHLATMGRDHYARVVYNGFLFPFGHRASLVKITERIFHPSLPGNPAYLRQRVFVVVREHDKIYCRSALSSTDGSGARFDLQMPFQRVRVTTMVTPNLDAPPGDNLSLFCPQVGGADLKFHLVAEDLDGNEIEFSAPLYFYSGDTSRAGEVAVRELILNYPSTPSNSPRGLYDFQGRRVPFAEGSDPNRPSDIKPGSTTFETTSVVFSATWLPDADVSALAGAIRALDGVSNWECHFYPKLTAANIVVPALKHLAGNTGPVRVMYDPVYRQHGFDGENKGQVFLVMASPTDPGGAVRFSGQGDRSGGLATPDMQMTALSRVLGPVAGNTAAMSGPQGSFNPADFFGALDGALLFGTIPLTVVLSAVGLDDPSKLPRFVTEGMSKLDGLIQDVAAAQQFVKAVSAEIDGAAASLGATTAVLRADVAAAAKDLDALATDLQGLHEDPKSAAQGFVTDLQTFVGHLQKLLNDLPALDAVADAKRSLQQILSRFQQEAAAAESIIDTLLAEQLTIKFVWNPVIRPIRMDLDFSKDPEHWASFSPTNDTENALFVPSQEPNNFKISVETQVAKTAAEPAMDIYCGLRDFKLQLIPALAKFVTLHFDVLEFTVSTGKSPDVNVRLHPGDGIKFEGPLAFVNTLEKLIPFDGFSDPPALSVTSQGITAGYSFGVPTVGIGVFSLQNISVGAGFKVPFIINPLELDFNFCKPEQPFLLTVSLFGGGGYFKMTATPKDIYVEAALEFGAAVAVNLGVASGGVYVMAGIMFAMDSHGSVQLAGFLRMGGNVNVLGLISMSIELDMELTYASEPNSVIGEATITVEVSVLFFHEAVSISCQKQFAGPPRAPQPARAAAMMAARPAAIAVPSGGTAPMPQAATAPPPPPPTFRDLMQPNGTRVPWRDYCRAFA